MDEHPKGTSALRSETGGQRMGESSSGGGAGRSRSKDRSFWKELPVLVIVALGLALLIKTFLVQAFYIPSESMENTLRINDRVLVNKLSYRIGEVERGDVIVFNGADSWQPEVQTPPPSNAAEGFLRRIGELFGFAPLDEKDFIKRVIGIPGDKVVCCDKQGRITVNGRPLEEESYLYPGDVPSMTPFEATVPAGRLWVMGDHRSASSDSRTHTGSPGGGTIPIDHVIGRAFVVVWPIQHWALLDRPASYAEAGLASAPMSSGPGTLAALGVALPLAGLRMIDRLRSRSGSSRSSGNRARSGAVRAHR
ncbi:MAG TPA: signal peptidase I [Actinopolymorphaceae bacterium]